MWRQEYGLLLGAESGLGLCNGGDTNDWILDTACKLK